MPIVRENKDMLVPQLRREQSSTIADMQARKRFFLGNESCLLPDRNSAAAAAADSAVDADEAQTASGRTTAQTSKHHLPVAIVSPMDCIECAHKHMLIDPARRPLMKVFGSDFKAGGGASKGSSNIQDEHSCYVCPYLLPTLQEFERDIKEQMRRERRVGEPWLAGTECIYIPSLSICRDQQLNVLPSFDSTLDVLYMPGLRKPPLTADGKHLRDADDRLLLDDKIRTWYRINKWGGHRVPVAGCFGCGAFRNPPECVIEAYLRIAEEVEFAGCFLALDFATLNTSGDNYRVFAEAVRAWNNKHQARQIISSSLSLSAETTQESTSSDTTSCSGSSSLSTVAQASVSQAGTASTNLQQNQQHVEDNGSQTPHKMSKSQARRERERVRKAAVASASSRM